MTKLGDMLAAARTAKEMRQRDVGDRLAGSPEAAQISNYERGRGTPSADRMDELIALLDLDPGEAWEAWGRAQLTDQESAAEATAPPVDAGALDVLVERRQHPRVAGGRGQT